ncbi:MAG: WYL domain-containing protein, partial [Mariprofundales bacterium]|nr:WYL domain-containing protein [Mariprofundales bacterium]
GTYAPILFSDHAAQHLTERPLSGDQSLNETNDGRTELVATVTDTAELRWWWLAFGERVEVLEPVEIRNYMIDTIQNMGSVYGLAKSRHCEIDPQYLSCHCGLDPQSSTT